MNRERFMLAEILPDMANSVFESHARIHTHKADGLYIPNLEYVDNKMRCRADWSVRMGIYAHLYLDWKFVLDFLIPKFDWDISNGKITNKASGVSFGPRKFFSEDGLYQAYSETTKILVESGKLKLEPVRNLPAALPGTGLKLFDDIVAESWKERFEWYIANAREQNEQMFSVEEYIAFIENQAVNATAQILHKE